ncbi:MAG: Flp pilus assembly complex ATPase component TadA [Pirellulales bacterium]|nr:Flp pilus assembly complex ATPase component TadA [Pirellulales bacterium]
MDLAKIFLDAGLLDEQQIELARQAEDQGKRLDEAAVQLGFITEEQSLRTIGDAVGLPFVDLAESEIDLSLLEKFPPSAIYRECLFPFHQKNGTLVVATPDPFNLYPLDELSATLGITIVPVLATRMEIAKLTKAHLGVGSETVEHMIAQSSDDAEIQVLDEVETDGAELSQLAEEPSVVRLVNEILLEAIEIGASDIHIESERHDLRVRYRLDGVLQPQPIPPEIHRFRAAIISRLKIMARLNIAERRLPQDGRIELKTGGREVDVRVSVIPMIHGEGIVLRLLDKGRMTFSLTNLGMDDDLLVTFREIISMPHGIVLVTGPTGSGKTTTLYSALQEIRSDETKIITTEDPVEYKLPGMSQIQVHPKIGLTFANSLRSILRHDPDVVLIGEIRDLETAENAIQASLTGHLVFSTLHTNDSAGAYTRLTDMGVEPFLVSSTVEAVMAQRLVRTVCTHCRRSYHPSPEDLPNDFPIEQLDDDGVLYHATGCRECRQVGYKGRIGLFELMVTTNRIRKISQERASSWEIKQAAIEQGMHTLRQNGWGKVLSGKTTVEEVIRVTKGDDVSGHIVLGAND